MGSTGEKEGKLKAMVVMTCLLAYFWSGCTEDGEYRETAQVITSFRLNTTSALGGKITIHEAYLKLDHIEVKGMFGGHSLAAISYELPPEDAPFKLSRPDSSYANFAMPVTPYDQIIYDLHLFQDTYELILHADSPDENPAPSPPPVNNPDGDGSDNDNGADPDETPPPPPNDNTGGDDDDHDDGSDDDGDDPGEDDDGDDDPGEDDDADGDNDDGDDDDGKKNKGKGKKKNKDNKGKKGDKDNDDDDHSGDRLTGTSNPGTADLDHFFQNAKPSLVVFGTYNNNTQPLTILFVVTGKEKITVQTAGNESIVVTTQNLADVVFDPEQWFASITTTDIESAQRQTYQGQEVVFIHKDVNSGLYEVLLSQLESSARLTFQSKPTP